MKRPTFNEWIQNQYTTFNYYCGHTVSDMHTAWDEQELWIEIVEKERDEYKRLYEESIKKD